MNLPEPEDDPWKDKIPPPDLQWIFIALGLALAACLELRKLLT